MSLQYLGKIAFPPEESGFKTVFNSVFVDDVSHEIVVINEKTNTELYRIGGASNVVPTQYKLASFDLPTYDLDLVFMGDKLLGVEISNINIKSIELPINNIISAINMSSIILSENIDLDVSAYGNLKNISIFNGFKGINIINLETAITLEIISIGGDVRNIAGDNFLIGSLNNLVELINFSIGGTPKVTSIGDINNLPNINEIDAGGCGALTSIGNLDSNPLLTIVVIGINAVLTTIGSLANLNALNYLQIDVNPSLTTIGSLANQGICLQYIFNGNALTSASVSQILVDIDTNGQLGGSIDISGGTNAGLASLTLAGTTAHGNLLGKGWGITINP